RVTTPAHGHVGAAGRLATEVELPLDPFESCFVVFGPEAGGGDAPRGVRTDLPRPFEIRSDGGRREIVGRVAANGACPSTLADGRVIRSDVKDVPAALAVEGPWTLALGGGPPSRLTRLGSWNELPEGRTFSGWGRYATTFELAKGTKDAEWTLDLGAVHETA